MSGRVVVAGAGGFVGGHLVAELLERGEEVRAVDLKPRGDWWQWHTAAENRIVDLRDPIDCRAAVRGGGRVFNLACDMGGIGFIEAHKAECMRSVLINTHLLEAARWAHVQRYFFSSSACVYPQRLQLATTGRPLREPDAYPADSEDGYGWEKLFSERLCRHYTEDFGLATRVARYFTAYGPDGSWNGGREKAPAAICRKIAQAKLTGPRRIEIWGDGEQQRSFMYASDVVGGTLRIMDAKDPEPLNLGSTEIVTINELVTLVEEIAGVRVERRYNLDAPQGVRSRNSDNAQLLERVGWEPSVKLREGLEITYRWIHDQVASGHRMRRTPYAR